ncbi:MAG: FHA domain-containing protein [Verrucomicrobia bacterium]|nr:FHA domain-containing protein [Verrucomicrobiota bacterium]
MPKLIMQGNGENQEFELPLNSTYRIGRSRHNDLSLEHASVSEHHCEIYADALILTVTDLGSTNGTFIDGEPIQKAQLRNGQVLQVGSIALVIDSNDQSDQRVDPRCRCTSDAYGEWCGLLLQPPGIGGGGELPDLFKVFLCRLRPGRWACGSDQAPHLSLVSQSL